jgi:hypothetical protein
VTALTRTPPDSPEPGLTAYQTDLHPSPGRFALRIVLAILIPCSVIAAVVYFGRTRPDAGGEVARVSVFPIDAHIHGAVPGATGMAGAEETYHQLLVFTLVRVRNLTNAPLRIDDFWAVVNLPNGDSDRSLAASDRDFDRVFDAYPQLTPIKMDPLRRDISIPPGGSVDGLLVFNYPISQQQWATRKSFNVTVSFANAREVTLRGPQG